MAAVATLEKERQAELTAAKTLVDKVKSEGRGLTDEERETLNGHLSREVEIKAAMEKAADDERMFSALGAALKSGRETGGDEPGRVAPRSLGEAFVKSTAYDMARTYAKTGGQYSTPAIDTGLNLKALTINPTGLGAGALNLAGYQEAPLMPLALQRPTIASLFNDGVMSGSILTYLKETAATSGAAAVAEGGVKPASSLTLTRVSHTISKIATVMDIPDEVLEDLDQARSYIDGRMTLFVQMEEEDQLLNGSGTAPNLTGLLNTSGIQTKTVAITGTDDELLRGNLEALYESMTLVRTVAFLEPDAIAVHPNDYQKFRLAKDANNQYYAGGPFVGQYGNGGQVSDAPLWAQRTVVTPAITEGTAIVGAWRVGATIFRRGGLTLDATNSDGDKFRSNITTIRAEERVGLAVLRPAAFVKVTFDWNTA